MAACFTQYGALAFVAEQAFSFVLFILVLLIEKKKSLTAKVP